MSKVLVTSFKKILRGRKDLHTVVHSSVEKNLDLCSISPCGNNNFSNTIAGASISECLVEKNQRLLFEQIFRGC